MFAISSKLAFEEGTPLLTHLGSPKGNIIKGRVSQDKWRHTNILATVEGTRPHIDRLFEADVGLQLINISHHVLLELLRELILSYL